ncbi:protein VERNALIZATION INSENSITIVE 3-like isoform X2 [Malania oleifera]|nr:protein VERNALIZATION INSENSITIVE 3-like isoform X2 [Malania oleifera]XP_057979844.1 protein VERNALIZATION INSENSITIVE 3-like isoform X2 [Malania oleifera]XP_057979845.1 protein VERNALIZATION INSENSITIVE 3-like isoform X2 [Malania oleifera]
MEEKRELVYELSQLSHGAPEMLQSWSRQEILQILCAEMGKERKYTGLTKSKIIENLLKIVSEKKSLEHRAAADLEIQLSPASQKAAKRQRKTDHPSRLPVAVNNLSISSGIGDLANAVYCKNSACKANLMREDAFCKRCSCCICYRYDDNKDPSLWLICSSEPPFQGDSCGMSCHLECALQHERSGISKNGQHSGLDGGFYCVSCGKVNDLLGLSLKLMRNLVQQAMVEHTVESVRFDVACVELHQRAGFDSIVRVCSKQEVRFKSWKQPLQLWRCWKKQLVVAKDTRRVDILCYRVSLSQKLLNGTKKYQKLYDIVDEAVNKLELEVGPLSGLPLKMGRGIVNRLSSGPEVQKLCALAVGSLDVMLSSAVPYAFPNPMTQGTILLAPSTIRFDGVSATSVTVVLGSEDPSSEDIVVYNLWHRKAREMDYPAGQTCTLRSPNARFVVSGLSPATEYIFKVISFNGKRESGMCEARCSTIGAGGEVQKSSIVERSQSPATNCSSMSNPSSVEDETNNVTPYNDRNETREDNYFNYCENADKIVSANISNDTIKYTNVDQEGAQADSVSVLCEERGAGMVVSAPSSGVLKFEKLQSQEVQVVEETSIDNRSSSPAFTGLECVPYVASSEAGLPVTPCKLDIFKDGVGRNGRPKPSGTGKDVDMGGEPQAGSSSKKRGGERQDEHARNDNSDRDFEYCVKIIRWLECEGHIEKNFRQKFLTWYSLRATPQEVRIVKVFVDTFIDDPASLAGQLFDTFSDSISSKRLSAVPAGFCMKLWH